jgi:sugar lactone lactonase YvrE
MSSYAPVLARPAAALAALVLLLSAGCGSTSSTNASCAFEERPEGRFVICDDGTEVPVPSGCSVVSNPDGSATIECDDGTSVDVGRPDDEDDDGAGPYARSLELLAGVTSVGSNDGQATEARMDGALHAAFSPDGEFLYFVDTFNQTIRRLGLATGQVVTLAGRAGIVGADDGVGDEATFEGPRGIAISPSGQTLYIADGFNCTIRTVDVRTREVRTLVGVPRECDDVDGDLDDARLRLTIGMQMHPDGRYLYFADRGNNRIRRIDLDAGVVEHVAGDLSVSFQERRGFADGDGEQARFAGPGGIDFDAAGEALYVNDTFNNVIRRIDLASPDFTVTTIAGVPGEGGNDDGVGDEARFAVSQGLTHASGKLYVAGFHLTIRSIDLESHEVRTVAGRVGASGSADGHPLEARFGVAFGIHAHPDGERIYYMDRGNNNIREFTPALDRVATIMGAPQPTGWRDGPGGDARFDSPAGVALAGDGGRLVYIADTLNHVVRRYDRDTGAVETIAGYPRIRGFVDGRGEVARMAAPGAIAIAEGGDDGDLIYVADSSNNAVRVIDLATGELTTVLGGPERAPSLDDGVPAADTVFNGPMAEVHVGVPGGLAFDEARNLLYMSDLTLHRLRVIDLGEGVVRTLAGGSAPPDGEAEYEVDGIGEDAIFVRPRGLALSADGEVLYVADSGQHIIRAIDIESRQTSTLAGEYGVPGAFNDVGVDAGFNNPFDVAASADGERLYIVDRSNHAIRRLELATAEVDTVVGALAIAGGSGFSVIPLDVARLYFPSNLAVVDDDIVLTASEALYRAHGAASGERE